MPFKTPEDAVRSIINNFPSRPYDKATLDILVSKTLNKTPLEFSAEIRKSQWEYAMKSEIFELAMNEGQALENPETTYFDDLKDRLNLVLTLTEHDVCEQTFPFNTLQDLLETQTISSCSHVFSWIESNADRLTDGMVPAKGKTLIILRMLNDLLRRLSKMGSNSIFCGRILTFLSGVFPLGERSGVNLRGEYGPMWETVEIESKAEDKMEEDAKETAMKEEEGKDKVSTTKTEGDETSPVSKSSPVTKQVQKEDFYNTFWSLQLPFSRPPRFASAETFNQFKEAVNKVLPVIDEATAKERDLMGSRSGSIPTAPASHSLKRKREFEPGEETTATEYFFAKFLTSPELLDLEIADTHFRRQFLFQLLILLNHLLLFTKTSRAIWSTTRNRSLQFDFTLEPPETQWVADTINKVQEELRQTTPGGRAFAESVSAILEREKNWVKWKNDLCTPFDREPYSVDIEGKQIGLWEETEEVRKKMRIDPDPWPDALGCASLTEIWAMGLRDLRDLENPFRPGEVKDFAKKYQIEDSRIELRKKQLAKTAERMEARAKAAAATIPSPAPIPTPAAPAPTITATAEPAPSTTVSATSPPSRPAAAAAAAAVTIGGTASPSLHPSLPAKPGSKPPSKGPDTISGAPSSSPVPPPTHAPAPAQATPLASGQPPTTVTAPTVTPHGATLSAGTQPAPTSSLAAASPPLAIPMDDQITMFQENKQRLSWLALRTARDQYLAHFSKIDNGDIVQLAIEIENDAKKELQERAAAAGSSTGNMNGKGGMIEGSVGLLGIGTSTGGEDGARDSPAAGALDAVLTANENGRDEQGMDEKEANNVYLPTKDEEGSVKMEV